MSDRKNRNRNPAVREIVITAIAATAVFVTALASRLIADATNFPFAVVLVLFLLLFSSAALLLLNFKRKRKRDDGTEALRTEHNNIFEMTRKLANPAVICDKQGAILWYNDAFLSAADSSAKQATMVKELFPNSHVEPFFQFPTQGQSGRILSRSIDYDQVIFLTFSEFLAYTGKEHLTRRVETLISAMQYTDRISTVIHYGNPTVLENIPHIPRIIFGGVSTAATLGAIDVLAGDYPANGKPTYKVELK